MFRALGDPTRRQILRMLSAGDLPAGDIAAAFDMTKPSISHHLAVLRQAGLVRDRRRGQQIIYSLETTVFEEAVRWIFEVSGRAPQAPGADSARPDARRHATEGVEGDER